METPDIFFLHSEGEGWWWVYEDVDVVAKGDSWDDYHMQRVPIPVGPFNTWLDLQTEWEKHYERTRANRENDNVIQDCVE